VKGSVRTISPRVPYRKLPVCYGTVTGGVLNLGCVFLVRSATLLPHQRQAGQGCSDKEHVISTTTAQNAIAVVGIDIGKDSFQFVTLDNRGAIVLRQKRSRSQIEARFANMPLV
jgi:hypothetical protein